MQEAEATEKRLDVRVGMRICIHVCCFLECVGDHAPVCAFYYIPIYFIYRHNEQAENHLAAD